MANKQRTTRLDPARRGDAGREEDVQFSKTGKRLLVNELARMDRLCEM
jgi:hypothetical protein